jgi:hypothetical protein
MPPHAAAASAANNAKRKAQAAGKKKAAAGKINQVEPLSSAALAAKDARESGATSAGNNILKQQERSKSTISLHDSFQAVQTTIKENPQGDTRLFYTRAICCGLSKPCLCL